MTLVQVLYNASATDSGTNDTAATARKAFFNPTHDHPIDMTCVTMIYSTY